MVTAALALSLLLISACSSQDTEKTKQEAAKATQQIKEGSKVAAVELKKDAKEAAKQTKAVAEGVKQGLATPDKPVNVNSASKTKLQTLPDIDEETAGRIIKGVHITRRTKWGPKAQFHPISSTPSRTRLLFVNISSGARDLYRLYADLILLKTAARD